MVKWYPMYKQNPKYIKFYNRTISHGHVDGYVRRCRLAFMMAFHKRLGEHTLIRRFMSRDIGRWFCERYITRYSNGMKQVIKFGEPTRPNHNYSSVLMISTRIFDYDDSVKRLYLQTPYLILPTGLANAPIAHNDEERYSIFARLNKNDRSHRILMENIEYLNGLLRSHVQVHCVELFRRRVPVDALQVTDIVRYSRTTDGDKDDPFLSVTLPASSYDNITVYCNKIKYTFRQALSSNLFGRGCRARFVFNVAYAYAMPNNYMAGYKFVPVQIEVLPDRTKDLDGYAFSDSE